MAFLRKLAAVYRLTPGTKIPTLRLVLYPLFGYAVSGVFHPAVYLLDGLMVGSWLLVASVLNDYYDDQLLGEQNALGAFLKQGRNPRVRLQRLALIPAGVSFGSLLLVFQFPVTSLAMLLWGLVLGLGVCYSVPPIRLKCRRVLGIITTPVALFALFLHGLTLLRVPDATGWLIAVLVWLFVWYLEVLHLVDDSLQPHEVKRLTTAQGMRWLRRVTVLGLGASLVLAMIRWIFWVSVMAWILRLAIVRRVQPGELIPARRNLRHPVWRLEEFAVYGLLGFARLFP